GVYIDYADVRAGFEQVDRDLPQPVVDFAAVDIGRRAVACDELRGRVLRGDRDIGAACEQIDGFFLAREQRGLDAVLRRALADRRVQQEVGAFHIVGLAGAFVVIRVPGEPMLAR